MASVDPIRLSKTMAFLLRHRPDVGGLAPDEEGWVGLEDLCTALTRLMRADVTPELVRSIMDEALVRRFEQHEGRIRALPRDHRPQKERRRCQPPDILYHATTRAHLERVRDEGVLKAGKGKHVFLTSDEAHAWRIAHRRADGAPAVLYVDASRARRHGVRFYRNRRNGAYLSSAIASQDILNVQPNFEEQISAGGVPVMLAPDGRPRVALVRVTRRSGVTWEVAKGKLEEGETPEQTAVREVREEMGVEVALTIVRDLGMVRYGFLAPGGLPRLKTVHLYLMRPEGPMEDFAPSIREGIGEVGWFTAEQASQAVTHRSLVPMMHHLRTLLEQEGERLAR